MLQPWPLCDEVSSLTPVISSGRRRQEGQKFKGIVSYGFQVSLGVRRLRLTKAAAATLNSN